MTDRYSIVHVPPSGTTQHVQHTWIAVLDSFCVGHIHMQLEANNRIKFLDAWVNEEHRRQGIFRTLWETRWKYVLEQYNGVNLDPNSPNYIARRIGDQVLTTKDIATADPYIQYEGDYPNRSKLVRVTVGKKTLNYLAKL